MSNGAVMTPRALRLGFTYQGGRVRLSSRQRVEVTTPPSDPTTGYGGESGFWYELRDADGRVLYRRVAESPIRFTVEVPVDDDLGASELARVPVPEPEGVFTLLVPDLEEARTLALVSSPLDPSVTDAATDLATFDLAEDIG
jgi:hypothetical protein